MQSNIFSKICLILYFVLLFFLHAYSQYSENSRIFSEAPIFFDNDRKMSIQLTVKFKNKIFDLAEGKREAKYLDMNPSFPNVTGFFNNLQNLYGEVKFIKQIPWANWNDVWRLNEKTGDVIKIFDMSQLFTVRFQDYVPIDSIITELENMDEVAYAHQPIQVVSFDDPNDPAYLEGSVGSQWSLYKINASEAWDISKGRSEIVAGIIEPSFAVSGLPNRNHPDLQGKFVENKGDFGSASYHPSMICGIIGASTYNGTGMASLGWEIMMIPYQFSSRHYEDQLVPQISRAVNDGVKIINFS